MDQGVKFVAYMGHGYAMNPGSGGGDGGGWAGWYAYQSVKNLNNQKLPIILAAACDTAIFHFPHYPYEKKSGGE
jgi:hypothetical protein